MSEMKIKNGDYVKDGNGGAVMLDGKEEMLQRVLYILTARRGAFPFMENTGSRLYMLSRTARSQRQSAAEQYAAEALGDESGLTVTEILLEDGADETTLVTVKAKYGEDELTVTATVQ